ncbi:hypothetical protein [Virgibacillus proomii]|uniref:hypothetical protein n=1 Tax=Virgibacillus proomii TaxID=84407 RepID=UPI0009870824|nr:hypothetical protein [Virgibacillus proomii]
MNKPNKKYRDNFYAKKASELNVKSPKDAKQIYEGLKHYTRLIEKYGYDQVQQWFNVLQGKSKDLFGGDK